MISIATIWCQRHAHQPRVWLAFFQYLQLIISWFFRESCCRTVVDHMHINQKIVGSNLA